MRVHRLISILLLIENQKKVKAKDLANKFETSIRTIYRDIDILCEAGFPIVTTTGPEGGIQFVDQYTVDIEDMASDEFINLYLSSMGIKPHAGSESELKLNNALLKLEKKLSSKYHHEISKVKKHFHFDETPWWEDSPKIVHMDTIIKSIFESYKLHIEYKKVNGDSSSRVLHPYGLVVKRMDWYLIAYCEKHDDIRIFKCERMADIKIMNETFPIPEDFEIETYWEQSEKGFKSLCRDKEVYLVTIKLNKEYIHILKNFTVYEIKQDNHTITATINLYKYEYAKKDILEFIGCCEVIEPIELRHYVKASLIKIINNY